MLEDASNQELLDAWRRGHHDAAEVLVRRYMIRLTALARSRISRKLARRIDGEDAVLSAWRSFFVGVEDGRITVPADDDLWPLLVTLTLRKLARQAARHAAQRRAIDDEQSLDQVPSWPEIVSREPSPEHAAMVADELESLMASLDCSDRELLSRRLQGQDPAAIGEAMGLTERTIRRRLQSIRELAASRQADAEEPIFVSAPSAAVGTGSALREESITAADEPPRTSLAPTIEYHDLRLQKLVGQGGFGKVYRAARTSEEITVAAKFLKKRFWRDRRCVQSMLDETTRLSALSHPKIIRHFGWGLSPSGAPFLVMEWIDGNDAAHWRQTCEPSIADVIECGTDIADALTAAHAVGIIHGDLSPANVLRRRDGTSILSDFGFSQWLGDPRRPQFGGTLGFLSPEQISDAFGSVGERTDVYGFGCLLYALVTGRPPFVGSVPDVLARTVSSREPDAPIHVRPDLPEDLERLILSCLRKEPAERPKSMAVVRASLLHATRAL
jgi:eukaryotic-like serine/threonine-protein kinase